MFKVGDKVRYKSDGEIGTVVKDVGDGRVLIRTAEHGICTEIYTDVEPVPDGPIRTVMRREIVPGVYGLVGVSGAENGRVMLHMDRSQRGATAEELREAAHLFNQLAEVLEDV